MKILKALLLMLLVAIALVGYAGFRGPATPAVLQKAGAAEAGESSTQPQRVAQQTAESKTQARKRQPPVEPFLVRPEGPKGTLVAYDMASGREHYRLPSGMSTADGKLFFAAEALPLHTLVQSFSLPDGNQVGSFMLSDRWFLSGVAPSGKWLALTRIPTEQEQQSRQAGGDWQTDIQIVEAATGKMVHQASLAGNFEVETISPNGNSLFLIQHLPAHNPDHYLIRLYNIAQEQLQKDPLVAKGPVSDQVMAGFTWDGVASPDGRWLLTLYVSTRRNVAFIHALNLHNKFPFCIDLPSGEGDFATLKHYSLALSPDGRYVYAANPALGVVATVDLASLGVTRVANFEPMAQVEQVTYKSQLPVSRSVISADGKTLYFAADTAIWVYDTEKDLVHHPLSSAQPVVGLGLSTDSSRLFIASGSLPPQTFDLASGTPIKASAGQASRGR